MPHCIIEHSSCLDGHTLIQPVYQGALLSQLFAADGSDIKVRSIAYQHYQTGEQRQAFVHVTLRLLAGRTTESKQLLAQSVMAQLERLAIKQASMTIEVVDIDRNSYLKKLV